MLAYGLTSTVLCRASLSSHFLSSFPLSALAEAQIAELGIIGPGFARALAGVKRAKCQKNCQRIIDWWSLIAVEILTAASTAAMVDAVFRSGCIAASPLPKMMS